jgi:hypothetical protein
MGTILRVTELEVREHPDAVVPAHREVVIVARTEPVEIEGPSNRLFQYLLVGIVPWSIL